MILVPLRVYGAFAIALDLSTASMAEEARRQIFGTMSDGAKVEAVVLSNAHGCGRA